MYLLHATSTCLFIAIHLNMYNVRGDTALIPWHLTDSSNNYRTHFSPFPWSNDLQLKAYSPLLWRTLTCHRCAHWQSLHMIKGGDVLFNRVGKVNSVKSNFYGEIIRVFLFLIDLSKIKIMCQAWISKHRGCLLCLIIVLKLGGMQCKIFVSDFLRWRHISSWTSIS